VKNTDPEANSLGATLLQYLKQEWKVSALQYKSSPKPITGGFETSIFKIQLQNAPKNIPETLIARIFKRYVSPETALRESIIQNAIADAVIPAPRVFLTCSDTSILGGEFNIMEYMSGRPMIETQRDDHPELLGRTHIRLHDVDPVRIIKTLTAHGFNEERFSLYGRLNWIQKRINDSGYDWLQPGLAWLRQNKPTITELAICHGDFHSLNILMHDGRISGVLDWSSFCISDPILDVAATKVILSILAPVLLPRSVPPDFVERYLAAYQIQRPLETKKLTYFEVVRMISGLINGADGQYAWRHKDVMIQVYNTLREYTELKINFPKYS
jgi:aminoglycoside phosphotransferase (APT) family kinase protein